jgi:uncharacterized damage-inducible protein DinB
MTLISYSKKDMLDLLAITPGILNDWVGKLPSHWVMQNEGGESWSAYDIVGHLIHGERTDWMARLDIILSDKAEKRFVPFDRFAQFHNSKGKSVHDLLGEFEELRKSNLSRLENIEMMDADLDREAIHPELGTVTLRQLLSTWVVHDQSHLGQIARVLAKQWKHEVGPWKEYIPILNR